MNTPHEFLSRTASAAAALALALAMGTAAAAPARPTSITWVASWTASPQPVWGSDFLLPANVPAELHGQTVRQLARISLGGPRLRIVLSNAYGRRPLAIGRATVALPRTGGAVDAASLQTVTFGGQAAATLLPGASLVSDPVALPLPALAQVAVSLYVPDATPLETFH